MRPLLLLFFGFPILAACSGSDNALIGGGDAGGATVTIGDGGAASTITSNGGDVSFDIAKVYLTRGEWCGSPPPFTSADDYQLVLEAAGPDPAQTVDIGVWATSPVGVAQALKVSPWKAGAVVTQGENDVNPEEATALDAKKNPFADFSLLRGLTPSLPDPNPYDQATLTVVALPQKEGDSLVVRIQLHFTDGKTLDETFTSPLAETDTPCGGAK